MEVIISDQIELSSHESFHDCLSQPTSPRPLADRHVNDGQTESSISNNTSNNDFKQNELSSKENSPRPDGEDILKKAETSDKLKKKEDKSIEYVLKALSSLSTPEEKLAALCKKYTDLLDENRQNKTALKSVNNKLGSVSKERDNLRTDNSKLVLAKNKLESLCRELQRQNKNVKDEALARHREEEEKRKEVSSKFQTTILDIQAQMDSHSKRNDKLQEENRDISMKLHTLIEQYEKREESIQKLLHQKDLERQLLEAKLAQCQLIIEKEHEKHGEEKRMLLEKLVSSKQSQEAMTLAEAHLKMQLQVYTEKYSEFESTLNKSNQMFLAYKTEMEKMGKRMKTLEKEAQQHKQRYENTNRALLEMVEMKQKQDKIIDTQAKKCQKLESLCRALQGRAGSEVLQSSNGQINDTLPNHSESNTNMENVEVAETTPAVEPETVTEQPASGDAPASVEEVEDQTSRLQVDSPAAAAEEPLPEESNPASSQTESSEPEASNQAEAPAAEVTCDSSEQPPAEPATQEANADTAEVAAS